MAFSFLDWFRRIAGLMILLLIGVGCASPPTPEPTAPLLQAAFTAIEVPGKVIHGENSESVLEKDSNVSIQVNDRIQLDETGQGMLLFPDRLEVRMFRRTEIQLVDAKEESSGSTYVNLFLSYGNTQLRLNEGNIVWAVLKTEYATVTTLAQGTDFVICHTPEKITCGVVNEGAVEFQAQGEKKIAEKGEAIYVRPGEPPSDAICARQDEVEDWLVNIQGAGNFKALGAIVQEWPQEPCSAAPLEPPISEITPLPGREGMEKVEAGIYEIGGPQEDDFHVASQEITLEEFWIDIYEVTNGKYQTFLDETGRQPPAVWPGEVDHPVKGVTWDEAAAYCAWESKRLPTEAEWEVAARGPGANPPLYPWGAERTAGGQADALPLDNTYPVGAYDFNKSLFGIYDMAGNVWEWVGEPYAPTPEGYPILRGGRHGLIRDSAYRQEVPPDHDLFIPYAGFRCAADRVEGG